ncbi:MAG: guanylate kinase [Christensenellaceae bacterium]|nr:guanylate kinase [Christensenellaceae bacterium]
MEKGLLIVLSGPSGTGKGTVCKALLKKHPEIALSVSCTTRPPRAGEVHGKHYFFMDREDFEKRIAEGAFLEYANVFSNFYGTPRGFVEETLAQGKDVLLEIDVQGALQVKESAPDGVFIFLIPPSMEELEKRIRSRATETEEKIRERLGKANAEMSLMDKYDYVIVNDEVDRVVEKIESILTAEKLSVKRRKISNERSDVK